MTRPSTNRPTEPADGRSCDGGYCSAESIGWRFYPIEGVWLPVCVTHMDAEGVPAMYRMYDPTEEETAR